MEVRNIFRIIDQVDRSRATAAAGAMDSRSQENDKAELTSTDYEKEVSPVPSQLTASSSDSSDKWPIIKEITPSWSDKMWRWGQNAVNMAVDMKEKAAAAVRSALGQPEPAPPSDRSSNSTPDSKYT